MTGFL